MAAFLRIAERGPPLLTPVLQMAARQSAFWRNSDDTIKNSEQFKRACDAIDAVAGSAITDGVFLAFIDSDIKPLREIIARTRAAGP